MAHPGSSGGLKVRKGIGLPGISLFRRFALEVVEYDARGYHFQKSINRILVARLKLAQPAALVRTQFEVGLLDKVVQHVVRDVRPISSRGAHHNLRNQWLKAANELSPCGFIIPTDARFDELYRG